MNRKLQIELSDTAFAWLAQQAVDSGITLEAFVAAELESLFRERDEPESPSQGQTARGQFQRSFGCIDLGRPTGLDNDLIDADLGREYSSSHEDD